MRILCFLPDLGGGGAQRTLINLANEFHRAGHAVVLGAAQPDGPARAWLDPAVDFSPVGTGQLRNAVLPLVRLIRQRRPHVLLSSVLDANLVASASVALAGRPAPKLILRETNSHRARQDVGRLRKRLSGLAYRRADAVVALSEGVRQELIEDYALQPSAVLTLHNPVAVEKLMREAEAATQPPVAKQGRWIMGVGRLIRQKGFDRLIRTVARLDRTDVNLVLIGEGPDRHALQALANDLGFGERLLMPGFVSHPVQWLAHADLFVLSSRWEGFGHVIVEAMTAGAPVISFDCPHGPRDIIRDGTNGLLVPEGNETALVHAMGKLLDDRDLARAFSERARIEAVRFSSARIAQEYLSLFSRL